MGHVTPEEINRYAAMDEMAVRSMHWSNSHLWLLVGDRYAIYRGTTGRACTARLCYR